MLTLAQMIAIGDTREGIKTTKAEMAALAPLTVLATSNPKKPGTMSWERFNGYLPSEQPSIGRALECIQDAYDNGLRGDDIRHDAKHGFIEIGELA